MPITFAHPAAVLPLARRGLVLSALAIGSMTPDFTYFLRISEDRVADHSLAVALRFGVPAGLVVLWLFQVVLKRPLLSLLPVSHQQRLAGLAAGFRFGPLRRFILIVVSLIIGAMTHLVWDAFTHLTGWGVRHLPILTTPVVDVAGAHFPTYKLLQYGSGILGVAVLVAWYLVLVREGRPQSVAMPVCWPLETKILIALAAVMSTSILGVTYALHWVPVVTSLSALRGFAGRAVLAVVWVVLAEVVVYSLFWHLQNARRQNEQQGSRETMG